MQCERSRRLGQTHGGSGCDFSCCRSLPRALEDAFPQVSVFHQVRLTQQRARKSVPKIASASSSQNTRRAISHSDCPLDLAAHSYLHELNFCALPQIPRLQPRQCGTIRKQTPWGTPGASGLPVFSGCFNQTAQTVGLTNNRHFSLATVQARSSRLR